MSTAARRGRRASLKLWWEARANVINGDARGILPTLPRNHYNVCVTSPPYYQLRNYRAPGQTTIPIGEEPTVDQYIDSLVSVFREVHKVLRDDGTLYINIDEKYEDKQPLCIPELLLFALKADGWVYRQRIIWQKPNCKPESMDDRCTHSHEYIFHFAKRTVGYYYDQNAIREPATTPLDLRGVARKNRDRKRAESQSPYLVQIGRRYYGTDGRRIGANTGLPSHAGDQKRIKRDVWAVPTDSTPHGHPAVYPVELVTDCILAGAPVGGWVLDPFGGSGTTGLAAKKLGRNADLIELNSDYVATARSRLAAKERACHSDGDAQREDRT